MDPILATIDEALKKKGLSDAAASKLAVGHPSLIKNLRMPRSGEKRYNLPSLEKLAAVLDLELYFGPPRRSGVAPEVEVEGHRFDTVPRYDAQAAGGHGALNLDADPIDRLAFNRDWLLRQGISAGHCALITAKGDSMEPRIYEGDLIMIDRRRTKIRNHHVYVFNDGDRGTRVKRLEHIPDLGIFLHSDNRENYPPESRIGNAANEIKVLGEVVWSGHKWT